FCLQARSADGRRTVTAQPQKERGINGPTPVLHRYSLKVASDDNAATTRSGVHEFVNTGKRPARIPVRPYHLVSGIVRRSSFRKRDWLVGFCRGIPIHKRLIG